MKSITGLHFRALLAIILAASFLLVVSPFYLVSNASFQNPTSTPISPITATLYTNPTPTPENAVWVNEINDLVNDSECLIPCWWGLQVGQSNENSVSDVLTTYFDDDWEIFIDKADDDKYKWLGGNFNTLPITEFTSALAQEYNLFGVSLWIQSDIDKLVAISLLIRYPEIHYVDWNSYLPSTVLSLYGIPDQVQVAVRNLEVYTPPRTALYLRFYSLGLYIEYDLFTPYTGQDHQKLNICNNLSSIETISIWVETNQLKFPTAMELALWDQIRFSQEYQVDIAEASDLTLIDFAKTFSQPDTCIPIPVPAQ